MKRCGFLKRVLERLILAATVATVAPAALGSGSIGFTVGNGADLHHDQNNAWFLGDRVVPYCVDRSWDFPLGMPALRQMVEDGLVSWEGFFHKYGIDRAKLGTGGVAGKFRDGLTRGLASRFVDIGSCQGLDDDGIRILFGRKDHLVEQYLISTDNSSLGAAVREEYDHRDFRNRGTIWVNGNVRDPFQIRHLLLHELGHVFGMKHDSVWVMAGRIANILRDCTGDCRSYLGAIELPSWTYAPTASGEQRLDLYFGRTCPPDWGDTCKDGYLPNTMLPVGLRQVLRLKEGGLHKLWLQLADRRVFGVTEVRLEIEDPTGFTVEVHGTVEALHPMAPWGPGIFTSWLVGNSTAVIADFRTFDQAAATGARPFLVPARGTLQLGNELVGIEVTGHPGVVVKLFLPGEGWWEVRAPEVRELYEERLTGRRTGDLPSKPQTP